MHGRHEAAPLPLPPPLAHLLALHLGEPCAGSRQLGAHPQHHDVQVGPRERQPGGLRAAGQKPGGPQVRAPATACQPHAWHAWNKPVSAAGTAWPANPKPSSGQGMPEEPANRNQAPTKGCLKSPQLLTNLRPRDAGRALTLPRHPPTWEPNSTVWDCGQSSRAAWSTAATAACTPATSAGVGVAAAANAAISWCSGDSGAGGMGAGGRAAAASAEPPEPGTARSGAAPKKKASGGGTAPPAAAARAPALGPPAAAAAAAAASQERR